MVNVFIKGVKIAVSEHFFSTDFDCHCKRPQCNETLINPRLPEALEDLHLLSGDFNIDSGFRCKAHNQEVGGAPNSQHTLGYAADCRSLKKLSGMEMAALAEKVPAFAAGGIGTYPIFAHCDVRLWRARWKKSAC